MTGADGAAAAGVAGTEAAGAPAPEEADEEGSDAFEAMIKVDFGFFGVVE